jgi:hypothetical protein
VSTNLFVLTSPLQVLNALEAREHFGLKGQECTALILESNSARNNLQLQRQLREEEWRTSFHIPLRHAGLFGLTGRLASLNGAMARVGSVDRLFLGDYSYDLVRHCGNLHPARSVILLDDGASILNIDRLRASPRRVWLGSRGNVEILKYLAKRLLLRIDPRNLPSVTYFTAYSLAHAPPSAVIHNHYQRLRRKAKSAARTDAIYFIGTNLSEVGGISREAYEASLRRVSRHLKAHRIVYMPHRLEAEDKLESIRIRLGFDIERVLLPLEVYLCSSPERPKAIAGFYSSAFIGCDILFGGEIDLTSFRLNDRDLRGWYRREAEILYDYYKEYCPNITIV